MSNGSSVFHVLYRCAHGGYGILMYMTLLQPGGNPNLRAIESCPYPQVLPMQGKAAVECARQDAETVVLPTVSIPLGSSVSIDELPLVPLVTAADALDCDSCTERTQPLAHVDNVLIIEGGAARLTAVSFVDSV